MAGATRSALTDEFWRGYRKAAGLQHDDYDVVAFGDGPDMATELAELTVAGIKRATAGLARQFGPDGEPLPPTAAYLKAVHDARRDPAIGARLVACITSAGLPPPQLVSSMHDAGLLHLLDPPLHRRRRQIDCFADSALRGQVVSLKDVEYVEIELVKVRCARFRAPLQSHLQ